MNFNFRIFLKSFGVYILFGIFSAIASTIIGNTILRTICNAIFGEEKSVTSTQLIMRILFIIIVFIGAFIRILRDDTMKKEYLDSNKEKSYGFKKYAIETLCLSKYQNECIAMGIIVLLFLLLTRTYLFAVFVIIFPLVSLFAYVYKHNQWIKSRIR